MPSQFDVGGTIQTLALLHVAENRTKLKRVSVVLETLRTLQVEPDDLGNSRCTF